MLATVVRCEPPASARPGDKAVITPDGSLTGWIGGSCSEPMVRREALRALADGRPRVLRIAAASEVAEARDAGRVTMAATCPSGGSLEIFIDPQVPPPVLLAFGDTPVATTIARLAELVGFEARAVGLTGLTGLTDLRVPEGDAWAVVCTMGHFDEEALEAALAHPGIDVALVASERRARSVLDGLRARGVEEAALARVRTPAGGSRGATQEEIALAALAEIAALRRQRRRPAPALGEERFATDPVCGMAVDVEGALHTVDREGQTHYFCGDGCRRRFLEDPSCSLERTQNTR